MRRHRPFFGAAATMPSANVQLLLVLVLLSGMLLVCVCGADEAVASEASVVDESAPAEDGLSKFRRALAMLNQQPPGDVTLAVQLLKEAAEARTYEAMVVLGLCYHRGHGVPVNQTEALRLFAEAAGAGSADGAFYASMILLEAGMHDAAMQFLLPAVRANHTEAVANYAVLLANGVGMPANPLEAVKYAQIAAERGSVPSMMILVQMLGQGLGGVAQDAAQAQMWAERAADLGNIPACLYAAESLIMGRGTDRDPQRAAQYLQKAAAADNLEAVVALGILYHGAGNFSDAARMFERALQLQPNDTTSQYMLGRLLSAGPAAAGISRDPKRGVALLMEAVRKRHAEAARALAEVYVEGRGVLADYTEANKWLNIAGLLNEAGAVDARKGLEQRMDPAAVIVSQRMAREWVAEQHW